MGKKTKQLCGGSVIPIPVRDEKSPGHREGPGIIWGEVVYRPKPFIVRKKEADAVKCYLLIRMGRQRLQRIPITSESAWFETVMCLMPGDRVLISGTYSEYEYTNSEGEEKIIRDFYIGFIVPGLAISNPELWQERRSNAPDPFYEAKREQENEKPESPFDDEGTLPDYSDGEVVRFRSY